MLQSKKRTGIKLLMIGCLFIASCSKSADKQIQPEIKTPHAVVVRASGTADYTVIISTVKKGQSDQLPLYSTSATAGTAVEYTSSITSGDYIIFEIKTTAVNFVNYSVTDNNLVVLQQLNQLNSNQKISYTYQVQ